MQARKIDIVERFQRHRYGIDMHTAECAAVESRVAAHVLGAFADRPMKPVNSVINSEVNIQWRTAEAEALSKA